MLPTEPLPLHHSWALFDRDARFDLGWLHDEIGPRPTGIVATIGRWECDLTDNRLTWCDAVYDLFGLPHGTPLNRADTVRQYAERSRAAMESLRAYAIRYGRGFTLDAEIHPANAPARWMRLVAAPVMAGRRVIRLEGVKLDVSDLYR